MTPRRWLLSVVTLALAVSACGGSAATQIAPSTGTLEPVPTAAPPETVAPGSGEPSAGPTDPPSAEPTEPTVAPATDEPSDAPNPAADACSGSDANRDFFAQVAGSVEWSVYCPVLPEGWFVEGGEYRLAGGGWLEITYEGPGGETIQLRQGAPCTTDGCIPSGEDLGQAAHGDLPGTLLDLGAGRFAVVVDAGANPSWTLVADGLAEADVRAIAADLALVGG